MISQARLLAGLLAVVSLPALAAQPFSRISAGFAHTCAWAPATAAAPIGVLKCWGDDSYGQLGDGDIGPNRAVPVDVTGISRPETVSAGRNHTCASVYDDASLTSVHTMCWGRNDFGQLGNGTIGEIHATPVAVGGTLQLTGEIAAGSRHTCQIEASGGVACWGSNDRGQLGNGSVGSYSPVPVSVVGLGGADYAAVFAGDDFTCAVENSDSHFVECWGADDAGQLAQGSFGPDRPTPGSLSGVQYMYAGASVPVALGARFGCGSTSEPVQGGGYVTHVKCWGADDAGQLGDGTIGPNRPSADNVVGMSYTVALAAGAAHACGLNLFSSGVKCWGKDSSGQLGDGTTGPDRPTPADVVGLTSGVSAIAAGGNHTCALMSAGGIKCWGGNASGELGTGSFDSSPVPLDIVDYPLLEAPTSMVSFSPNTVVVGGGTQLTISLTNPAANAVAINALAFSDMYPAEIINSSLNPVVSNSCGGTLAAPANGNQLKVGNVNLPVATTCSVVVNVVGIHAGTITNSTGVITSANAALGKGAMAILTVNADGGGLTPFVLGDGMVVTSGGTANTVNDSADSVLANDVDPNVDGQLFVAALMTSPNHGTLSQFDAYGHVTYVNNGDGASADSFRYKACDSAHPSACWEADVTITVLAQGIPLPRVRLPEVTNDAAVVQSGGTTSTLFDGSDSVLLNDIDPVSGGVLVAHYLGDPPDHGLVTLFEGTGHFGYANSGDSSKFDTFHYEACDSIYGACSLGIVSITVSNGQTIPTVLLPVAVDDAIQVKPGETATSVLDHSSGNASVLWNDFDPNAGGVLSAALVSNPHHGVLTFNAPNGTFSYQNDGDISVTSDDFVYQACDSLFGACSLATVSISIQTGPLNSLPVPTGDSIHVLSGGTSTTLVGGAASVLSNDTDPDAGDGTTLQAFLIGGSTQHGDLTLAPDGTFSYVNHVSDTALSDGFTYEACDVHGACASSSVTITVEPVDGPNPTVACTLNPQVNSVGATISLDLSKLFSSPPGTSLSYGAVGLPSSLSVNATTGILSGTLVASDVLRADMLPGETGESTYTVTLKATVVANGGGTVGESVPFHVLAAKERVYQNGFDAPPQSCQ